MWGEARYGTLPTGYQYTSQYHEDYIELYWYNSRWYDPALGRFAQADTIIPDATQGVQAWDRFAYVNNNPVRFSDASGSCIGPASMLLPYCILAGIAIVAETKIALMEAEKNPFIPNKPEPTPYPTTTPLISSTSTISTAPSETPFPSPTLMPYPTLKPFTSDDIYGYAEKISSHLTVSN
jgi:RHS repeat-associated protein